MYVYVYIHIHTCIHTYIHIVQRRDEPRHFCQPSYFCLHLRVEPTIRNTANLCTKILDFRGLDSSRTLISRGRIPMSTGYFLEMLSRQILAAIILVGSILPNPSILANPSIILASTNPSILAHPSIQANPSKS